jgi:hypothetical protein
MAQIRLILKTERKLIGLPTPRAKAKVELSHEDFLAPFWRNERLLMGKLTRVLSNDG